MMARYEVTFVNSSGRSEKIIVEASDVAVAERAGKKRGKLLSVRKKWGLDMKPGMTPSERYTFLVRMSSMMGSRLGAGEALRLISKTFGGSVRRAANGLLDLVESGAELPKAMDMDRKNFPATLVALVKAGASSGETWRALKDAADFEYKMQTIRKGSGKELGQAIFTFMMAGALTVSSTQYFGPQVLDSDIFRGNKAIDIGWITTSANVMTAIMGVMLFFIVVMLWLATAGRRIVPVTADRIILKVPFYKDLVLARDNYATLYKLGLLIKSGVRIEEALRLTEEGAPRGALRNDLSSALKAVRNGRPWAEAMRTLHPTDRAALVSSTNRDDIARTLDILSTQYQDLYVQRISTFAPAMKMVAAVFMTIAGGVLFGMTILPMLQLAKGISV